MDSHVNRTGARRRIIIAQIRAENAATLPMGFVGGHAGSDMRPMVPETDNGMVHEEAIPTKRRAGRPRNKRVDA
tara:strand:+ start:261 stop:482 length:222 start_codon:yes stop_codon:yes gene_type:complete